MQCIVSDSHKRYTWALVKDERASVVREERPAHGNSERRPVRPVWSESNGPSTGCFCTPYGTTLELRGGRWERRLRSAQTHE